MTVVIELGESFHLISNLRPGAEAQLLVGLPAWAQTCQTEHRGPCRDAVSLTALSSACLDVEWPEVRILVNDRSLNLLIQEVREIVLTIKDGDDLP